MLDKYPKIWLVIYLVLFLWNLAGAIIPGGPPVWVDIILIIFMALGVAMCVVIIKSSRD